MRWVGMTCVVCAVLLGLAAATSLPLEYHGQVQSRGFTEVDGATVCVFSIVRLDDGREVIFRGLPGSALDLTEVDRPIAEDDVWFSAPWWSVRWQEPVRWTSYGREHRSTMQRLHGLLRWEGTRKGAK